MDEFIFLLRQIKHGRAFGARWSQLRYFGRWKGSLAQGRSTMQDRMPWLSFPAIDHLLRNMRGNERVFEYGGGGSTLFWCDRAAEVVTVEHDGAWFSSLRTTIEAEGAAKWSGQFIASGEGDLVPHPDPAEPLHFSSADVASAGKNYKSYVQAIDAHPDGYFDIVLIDGRSRASCLSVAVRKLRDGGLLILDNAEREYYTQRNAEALRSLQVVLAGKAPVPYSRDLSETRIYRKR